MLNLVVFLIGFFHCHVIVICKGPTPDIAGTESLYIHKWFQGGFCGCFVLLRVPLEDNSTG